MDWYQDHQYHEHQLHIGSHAIIRSHTTIYGGSAIGDHLQTGHYADIREHSQLGSHVSVGATIPTFRAMCRLGTMCDSTAMTASDSTQ